MSNFERYKRYLEDINIANKAIEKSLIVPGGELVCDLYALPSLPTHDYTVYYAKVYEDDGKYHMVYARPEAYSYMRGEKVRIIPFKLLEDNKDHGVVDTKIIVGLKTLTKEFETKLRACLSKIPTRIPSDEMIMIVDGVGQGIRTFKDGLVDKTFFYSSGIDASLVDEATAEFLEELFIEIEKILELRNVTEV